MRRIGVSLGFVLMVAHICCPARAAARQQAEAPAQRNTQDAAQASQGPGQTTVINGPPDSAELAKDPRLAQFDPPDRQFVVTEMGTSKAYCESNPIASGLLDCDCFARTVFQYRLAHANDRAADARPASNSFGVAGAAAAASATPASMQRAGNSAAPQTNSGAAKAPMTPIVSLAVSGDKLNCGECISDAKVTKWAADEARKSLTSPLLEKPVAEPRLTQAANCVSQTFLASFREKPFLGMATAQFDRALANCQKQSAH